MKNIQMEEILKEIDFADSEYQSFEWENGTLTIILKLWDENKIKLTFDDAIQFSFKLGDIVAGVYLINNETEFLKEALSRCYEQIPKSPPYKHYTINDINDFAFCNVIAINVHVEKSEST